MLIYRLQRKNLILKHVCSLPYLILWSSLIYYIDTICLYYIIEEVTICTIIRRRLCNINNIVMHTLLNKHHFNQFCEMSLILVLFSRSAGISNEVAARPKTSEDNDRSFKQDPTFNRDMNILSRLKLSKSTRFSDQPIQKANPRPADNGWCDSLVAFTCYVCAIRVTYLIRGFCGLTGHIILMVVTI